jgi:hypothetical protein
MKRDCTSDGKESDMKKGNVPTEIIGGIVVVGVLCTLLTHDGWLVWPPILLALNTAKGIAGKVNA